MILVLLIFVEDINIGAAAASAQPPVNWSFYVKTTNTAVMQTLGCNQATYDNTVSADSEVILDFGAIIDNSGTQRLVNGTSVSQNTVINLANYFAYGYATCTSVHTLKMDVGTNNSNTLNYAKGQAFANTAKQISLFVGYFSNNVQVRGANDIETFYNPGSGYHANSVDSYNWYNGYAANGGPPYVNYGSADGCPQSTSYTCSYGWNQGDYYNLSYGLGLALFAPEIYVNPQAQQWYWVEQFAGQPMYPEGPLDENDLAGGTYTPAQAWSALSAFFGVMRYSLEIHNSN